MSTYIVLVMDYESDDGKQIRRAFRSDTSRTEFPVYTDRITIFNGLKAFYLDNPDAPNFDKFDNAEWEL